MPGDYAVLAPIYSAAGLSDYSYNILPRLIDYAQRNDWIGRRILDLGCGNAYGWTHSKLRTVTYNIIGVDESPEMLREAEQVGLLGEWLQGDIRKVELSEPVDLVVALDVLNDLNALSDLEAVFRVAHKALPKGKIFIFDMQTIEGLTQAGAAGDQMIRDDDHLTVFARNEYDYERQMLTRLYTLFGRGGQGWDRREARQTLRAFPVQAVATLLQRSGFSIMRVLGQNLDVYEMGASRSARVYFFGVKG
jgi:SAM-dependent methyltransferase